MNGLTYRHACTILAVALALSACGEPRPKPAPPPEEATVPKLGVVAHVSEVKERTMTMGNWKDVGRGLFSQNTEGNVVATRYHVTVFHDDSSTGEVVVDQKPNLTPGQRVRVIGNRIEPVHR